MEGICPWCKHIGPFYGPLSECTRCGQKLEHKAETNQQDPKFAVNGKKYYPSHGKAFSPPDNHHKPR